jgi:hypothetical protein
MMSSSFTFNILFNLSNHSGVISLSVKYPLFLLSVGFAVAVVIYPSVLDCDSSINASNKTRAIDITSCTHYCILSYWKCKAYHKKIKFQQEEKKKEYQHRLYPYHFVLWLQSQVFQILLILACTYLALGLIMA